MSYYSDKIKFLNDIFGSVTLKNSSEIIINSKKYEIIDDVIILNNYQKEVDLKKKEVISSFSNEWNEFNDLHTNHTKEFNDYFDIIDVSILKDKVFADFGCGIGRWTKILNNYVETKYNILIDYSDSIFQARNNLKNLTNSIFIKADIDKIKLKSDIFDFFICLGVLHHIPLGIKSSIRNIANSSNEGICYLYYDFENRGYIFKTIFKIANLLRNFLCNIKNKHLRKYINFLLVIFLYCPFIYLSKIAKIIGLNYTKIPLSYYINSDFNRLFQDSYDRFFTNIEHRFSKTKIEEYFKEFFDEIVISNNEPYWHFVVKKHKN